MNLEDQIHKKETEPENESENDMEIDDLFGGDEVRITMIWKRLAMKKKNPHLQTILLTKMA